MSPEIERPWVGWNPTVRNSDMRWAGGSILLLGMLIAQVLAQAPQSTTSTLLGCGVHGEIEVLCGIRQPEDLERTPDGKFLIATQYLNEGRGGATGGGMVLFDLAKKSFGKMPESVDGDKSWGDSACPGPIGDSLVSHGSSLAKRRDGKWALYVVNHGGRQSIEMFELKPGAGSWALVWRGCELAVHDYNDVAILPDGGFVGTYPSGLSTAGGRPAQAGGATGYVARWTPGKAELEVPGTRMRLPNGVVVSVDGRYMYVNEFGARVVRKFDLENGTELGKAAVEFLPDNLTWAGPDRLLVAGVKGARGDCPQGGGRACIDGFGVAEIDASKMQARAIFDSASVDPLISGVSVALKVDDSIYLGAFLGDRIVRIPYRKGPVVQR
jgi:SMP-30/Gluconolactonase/LRE-like region